MPNLLSISASFDYNSPTGFLLDIGKKAKIKVIATYDTTTVDVSNNPNLIINSIYFDAINIASYNPTGSPKHYIYGISAGLVNVTIDMSFTDVVTVTETQTIALSVVSGGGSGYSLQSIDPVLTALSIGPANYSIASGTNPPTTIAYTATATKLAGLIGGSTISDVSTTTSFTSSDTAVASFVNNTLTHDEVGVVSITGNYYGVGDTTPFTVTTPVLNSIDVYTGGVSIPVGVTYQMYADGMYDNGKKVDITNTAVWTANPPTAASVVAGLVTGLDNGAGIETVTVRATQATLFDEENVYIEAARPVTLAVTPINDSIAKGIKLPYTATLTYTDASTVDVSLDAATSWMAADIVGSGVATLELTPTKKRYVTGSAIGTASVAASYYDPTYGNFSDSVTLSVTPATILTYDISPKNHIISVGDEQQFTAIGTFTDDTQQNLTQLSTWSTTDESIAVATRAAGVFSGISRGKISVGASYNPTATTFLSVADGIDDDYILTFHESNADGFDVPISKFQRIIDSLPTGISSSLPIDLGFTLNVDGQQYTKFIVTKFGSVFLGDASININDSYDTDPTQGNENLKYTSLIKNLSQPNMVLMPWAGELGPIFSNPTHINTSTENQQKIVRGIEPTPGAGLDFYDETNGGVFVNICDFHPLKGRRTIIRWNCLTTSSNDLSDVLKAARVEFECSIYENGKIEFSYGNRKNMPAYDGSEKGYSIGSIWPTNSYTVKFKDFSTYLKSDPKNISIHGGSYFTYGVDYSSTLNSVLTSYDLTYFDSTLTSNVNWPFHNEKNGTFTYLPIPKRRKTLPRKEIRRLDIFNKDENKTSNQFDDRLTVNFTTSEINMPSNLPRFYGSGVPGVAERQDLFTHDFLVSKEIRRDAIENWLGEEKKYSSSPFSEVNAFELDATCGSCGTVGARCSLRSCRACGSCGSCGTVGARCSLWSCRSGNFYQTGTHSQFVGLGFSAPLREKSIIRMEHEIGSKTILPDVTSSILFYNKSNKRFEIIASNDLKNVDNVIFDFPNDSRLFGALGNHVSSGSIWNGLDFNESTALPSLLSSNFSKNYASKPFEIDPNYSATDQQILKPNLLGPFLIEKIIVQLPVEAGPGWFQDVTKTYKKDWITPDGTGDFNAADTPQVDLGGPAITVALSLQRKSGEIVSGSNDRRSLIAKGVITHKNDVEAENPNFAATTFSGDIQNFIVFMQGIKSFGVSPDAIIEPDSGGFFTGSVRCEIEASTGAGNVIAISSNLLGEVNGGTGYASAGTGSLGLLLSSSISLYDDGTTPKNTKIISLKPFGRDHMGIDLFHDDRSVFGNNYEPGEIHPSASITNPFYVPNAKQTGNKFHPLTALNPAVIQSAFFRGAILNENKKTSPFLIYPGENLVFSVSKTRPVYGEKITNGIYEYSGSHDIKIGTGSLCVTLYGSYLQKNQAFYPSKKESGLTHAVQRAYGDEPVFDQFDIESTDSLVGSVLDAYVTGSMSSNRGRVFSIFDKQANKSDILDNSTVSRSQLTPKNLPGGIFRNCLLIDASERYYDSMLPAVDDILRTDGTVLSYVSNEPYLVAFENNSIPVILDYYKGWGYTNSSIVSASNNTWTKSFPFENKYKELIRQNYPIRSSVPVKYKFDAAAGQTITPLTEFKNGFKISLRWPASSGNTFNCALDETLPFSSMPAFIPISNDDMVKSFYGFGDQNTRAYNPSGTVNFPKFAVNTNYTEKFAIQQFTASIGPIIRGWKYGIKNGFASYSTAVWRRDRYGQFRDMLEQRLDTAFFKETSTSPIKGKNSFIGQPVVKVNFYFRDNITNRPEETQSSNITQHAISNLPYIDGAVNNRETIHIDDVENLNNIIII